MGDLDQDTENVLRLRSISSKFACYMEDIHFVRPTLLARLMFREKLQVLTDQTNVIAFGSFGEVTQYPYESVAYRDIDIIEIYYRTVAVEDVREITQYNQEAFVYHVENNGCLPGYCLLRILNDGSYPLLQLSHLYKELSGRKYLMSSASRIVDGLLRCSNDQSDQCDIQYPDFATGNIRETGSAISKQASGCDVQSRISSFGINYTKFDFVSVIHCPKWPSCSLEWVSRIRPYGWPSQQQISEIVKKGIYLAPIGSKQSELENIQWRYSFNEGEKILVRSFNFTQVKCYVLLKMLISVNVTQRFNDDVVSSYHIKTLMFWTIEQTDPQLWVSHNLVELIFHVLDRLFLCVKNVFCPSYFIPNENLFACKVTPANMEAVSEALSNIICAGWVALTRLDHFARDGDFIQSLYQDNEFVYDEEVPMVQISELNSHNNFVNAHSLSYVMLELLNVRSFCNISDSVKMDAYFNEVINKLLQKIYVSDDLRDNEILQYILATVWCSYGTHVLSLSRCPSVQTTNNRIVEELGLICTKHACKSNLVDCHAKYANYTYITGDFPTTIATAQQLLDRYTQFPIRPPGLTVNLSNFHDYLSLIALNAYMNGVNPADLFDNHCHLECVYFLKNEIYALPDDARVEMFNVRGAESHFQTDCRFWFGLNPFVYLAYLAFLANFDSGHQDDAEAFLRKMEIICSTPPTALEPSSLNLLGVCYVKMGKLDNAIETFFISVKRGRCNNAAVWHVARLLWRKLRDRRMETHEK